MRKRRPIINLLISLVGMCLLVTGLCSMYSTADAQPATLVAIHVSELTEALETMPATPPTPTGLADSSGYEWWYTSWHYFVGYSSLQEALRADGTPFVTVSDSDIAAGRLLNSDGTPAFPILISIASEAIADQEVPPLVSYVNAGGNLLVGSSSFTRYPNGTSRNDFAIADQMGVHTAHPGLMNWYANSHLSKKADGPLTSHIPPGYLNWYGPLTADDVPWGVSPSHTLATTRWNWQVVLGNATELAAGDGGPLLTSKKYGQGQIIYHSEFQPLIGHDAYDPGMYEYVIYRRAIEGAFASFGLPLIKVSPWPFRYDAALLSRHDFEADTTHFSQLNSSARFEKSIGVHGDYYMCTGALRVNLNNDPGLIADLQDAVGNYGATIGSHNGGLRNPNNPALSVADTDYWHWGPDEALNTTPAGYASGKEYAYVSLLGSFSDLERWLTGYDNGRPGCGAAGNCPRTFSSPYFNGTRSDSRDILQQLGVITTGEQKIGPFPHRSLSYKVAGKLFSAVQLPVSDWFVGNSVAQAIDDPFGNYYHTTASIHAAVDFYHGNGFLINFYGHTPANDGSVGQEYLTYSMSKPNLWSTNAVGLYDWAQFRSTVTVAPTVDIEGGTFVATATVSGASDPQTAIEVVLPQQYQGKATVYLDDLQAAAADFRATANGIKVRVGNSVSKVRVEYPLAQGPVAKADSYSVNPNTVLSQPAPGVLANDSGGAGSTLKAVLASGPSHGTLVLNGDGSFVYTPALNYVGSDTFTYKAEDGTATSAAAGVSITITAPAPSTLTLNQSTVTGGSSVQATVTLAAAASSGGVVVNLAGDSPAITVPASVTVAAGENSASFAVQTSGVAAATPATISASSGGVTRSVLLTVTPPVLTAFSLSSNSVTGGTSVTGTLTINGPAPSSGLVVALSANSSATGVPATVTIAAGQSSATVAVTTSAVTTATTSTISASYGGITLTAPLTVNPAAVVLSNLTLSTASVTGGTSATATVTLSGAAPTGGVVVSASDDSSATGVPATVTIAAGQSSASFTVTSAAVTTATTSTIAVSYGGVTLTAQLTVNPPLLAGETITPSSVVGGTNATGSVTLSGPAPSGGMLVLLADNSEATTLPASVTVPAGSSSASFPVTTSAVTASTTSTVTATGGEVSKTANLTVTPPVLSSLSLRPTTVYGRSTSTGTVTLSGPAPADGVVVVVSDNSTAASVPASVTVPAGSRSATFTITTTSVYRSTKVTISAVYAGVTKTATLTIR